MSGRGVGEFVVVTVGGFCYRGLLGDMMLYEYEYDTL